MTTHRHSLSGKYTSSTDVPIPSITNLATKAALAALEARIAALETPVVVPPVPPTNVQAVAGDRAVALTWTEPV